MYTFIQYQTFISFSNILPILMGDEIQTCIGIIRHVGLHHFAASQHTVFHHAAAGDGISMQGVFATENGKVGQADLVGVSIDHGGHAEEARVDGAVADVQLEIASIIQFRPLEFAVVRHQEAALVVGRLDGDVLAIRTRARYRRPGKFHPDAAFPRLRVVGMVAQPDQITDPVCVGISSHDDVVSDVVLVQRLICAISVRLIAIPRIIIQWIDIAVGNGLVETGEH